MKKVGVLVVVTVVTPAFAGLAAATDLGAAFQEAQAGAAGARAQIMAAKTQAPNKSRKVLIMDLKKATNPDLESFRQVAQSMASDQWTVSTAYKAAPDAAKPGETPAQTIERLAKFSLHRDYPITGDEDGYDLAVVSPNTPDAKLESTLDQDWIEQTGKGTQAMAALAQALKDGLLVLSGSGSGNNTMASIIVVADPASMEFVTLMNSNFGSDD